MRKIIVALILEKNGKILVEKRKQSKLTTPGDVIFPAGHVEESESREEALKREMKEELGIEIENPQLVYQTDFDCEEKQRIFWYCCDNYSGSIKNNEAEQLIWISPLEIDRLTHQVSKEALNIYLKNKGL
jgi:8-oxo-dGTP diphosphatase